VIIYIAGKVAIPAAPIWKSVRDDTVAIKKLSQIPRTKFIKHDRSLAPHRDLISTLRSFA